MNWNRLSRILLILASGGMLLQTTATCQDQLASAAAQVATSLVLNALLGGLAT
jgi:hypothetical protein